MILLHYDLQYFLAYLCDVFVPRYMQSNDVYGCLMFMIIKMFMIYIPLEVCFWKIAIACNLSLYIVVLKSKRTHK